MLRVLCSPRCDLVLQVASYVNVLDSPSSPSPSLSLLASSSSFLSLRQEGSEGRVQTSRLTRRHGHTTAARANYLARGGEIGTRTH